MVTRILKFPLLFFVVCIIGTIYSCRKPQKCGREYAFNFPTTISPELDSFSIGDTIWYEVEYNNLIKDEISGQMVDITNLELDHFEFNIDRIDTTRIEFVGGNFDFFAIEGIFEPTLRGGKLYVEKSINNRFKMFFIPQKKGVYLLNGALPSYYINEEEIEIYLDDSPCISSVYRGSRLIPNNENNDFSLFEDRYIIIPTQTSIDTTYWSEVEDPQGKGFYVFSVD